MVECHKDRSGDLCCPWYVYDLPGVIKSNVSMFAEDAKLMPGTGDLKDCETLPRDTDVAAA